MSSVTAPAPPDVSARSTALDPTRSILVQAPAGSGKTDLLTRRFLRLLSEVDDPGQIVAITFTKAAAAEMRQRIMSELEKADAQDASQLSFDELSLEVLANRVLERSRRMDWRLLDLPSRLRISTIDSFCRELAVGEPLLSGVGGNLEINEQPEELYRRAARLTLERLGDSSDPSLAAAIEALLLWRDNNWQEMEDLLLMMLGQRDRWMQDFVLVNERRWEDLRVRLERPFADAVANALSRLIALLNRVPVACDEVLELARFAFRNKREEFLQNLAALAELPCGPFTDIDAIGFAHQTYACLAQFLLTQDGSFRQRVDKSIGFPAEQQAEKLRLLSLIGEFKAVPGMDAALDGVRRLPHCRYTEDEWLIVRACFIVLRHAAGQLKTVIAEAGAVDFIEVAQIAQHVLENENGFPTDAALAVADGIRHLLVDEFQDTSRRQHQLLSSLVAAWPDQSGRSVFVVGDPMQSIYFFRDAEVELFQRIRTSGLESGDGEFLQFTSVDLTANFRTAPELVNELNSFFTSVVTNNDGGGIAFTESEPARPASPNPESRLQLHLGFVPQAAKVTSGSASAVQARQEASAQCEAARAAQIAEIINLVQSHADRMEEAAQAGRKYRVAILGRSRSALAPIADALREAKISFRAIDLEPLKDRPEILDALALARALMNHHDRISWLGVLRAPWCGLSLEELHKIAGTDEWSSFPHAPLTQLLKDRKHVLSDTSRRAVDRVLNAVDSIPRLRAILPTSTLGTLLRQVWLSLGGDRCVDATSRANLDLFWKLLDSLPHGDQDLFGRALHDALEKLCAQPDPAANNEVGVQLMTIHKSKGLEFEVVIVPDLHATTQRGSRRLLSWLERGLAEPGQSGDVTEFLVAPMQPRGDKRGKAKEWVDRVYFTRESQEIRRILYVAATRAREELHMFARPAYKHDKDNSLTLVEPSNSLLATAWPAVADQVKARFEEWKATTISSPIENPVVSLAASEDTNMVVMPRRSIPTLVRRLPGDFQIASSIVPVTLKQSLIGDSAKSYQRQEGSLLSRALGNAVHWLLERLAYLRAAQEWVSAIAALPLLEPVIIAQIRAAGFSASEAASVSARAIKLAQDAGNDPVGQWILSPHAEAASEAGWAGIVDGSLHQVRVDRVFRAGPSPMMEGNDTWWVIDFKTAHADEVDLASALPVLRAGFARQLETYSAILRNLEGATANLRAGLYYPRMSVLDWWEA
jgi:ATP-dependent exoDNAse (exonuclease V) beta subunit